MLNSLNSPYAESAEFTENCPEFTVFNVFFILQNFEQLALALKNRVCLKNVHCIEIRIFE